MVREAHNHVCGARIGTMEVERGRLGLWSGQEYMNTRGSKGTGWDDEWGEEDDEVLSKAVAIAAGEAGKALEGMAAHKEDDWGGEGYAAIIPGSAPSGTRAMEVSGQIMVWGGDDDEDEAR
jgi:hypothetical protein